MAARRLLIVMLVLLGISTLAAALIPTPDRSGSPTGATDTIDSGPDEKPARQHAGRLVRRTVRIGEKPAVVHVHPGDQLRLAVAGKFGDDVEIPALGLTATMTPYAPAMFDVIVPATGTFAIRAVHSGTRVGRIESQPRTTCATARRPAPQERSRPGRCDRRDERRDRAGGRSDRQP